MQGSLALRDARKGLEKVVRPKSLVGGIKKAGVILMLAPDPITGIPGAALLASSYVLKKREPSSIKTLVLEARRLLREIDSLRI